MLFPGFEPNQIQTSEATIDLEHDRADLDALPLSRQESTLNAGLGPRKEREWRVMEEGAMPTINTLASGRVMLCAATRRPLKHQPPAPIRVPQQERV